MSQQHDRQVCVQEVAVFHQEETFGQQLSAEVFCRELSDDQTEDLSFGNGLSR